MKAFRIVCLASLLAISNALIAQTVTMSGKTETMKLPATAEPFQANSQAAAAQQGAIPQPALEESLPPTPAPAGGTAAAATTVQPQSLTAPGATLGSVFDVPPAGLPPDSAIASGPNHVLTIINSVIQIFNKSGTLVSSTGLFTLFSTLPNSGSCCFDPRATYDQNHGRFIIAAAAVNSTTSSHIFFAVSQTSDPTGTWFKYDLSLTPLTPEGDPASVDFPSLGVSNGLLLLSASLPQSNLVGTESTSVWALQLAPLLTGNSTLSVTTFNNVKLPSGGRAFTIQPAVTYGTPGTAYLASTDGNPQVGGSAIHLFTVPETATPTLSVVDVPVAAYKVVASAPQPNTTTQLTVSGDIMISSPVWRNGSLWVAHAVADSTGTIPVVRWYEVVTGTKTVRQSGTLTGAGAAWYPSITVTASGATDIVFHTSSSTQFASPTFAHREASDPLGTMPVQAIYQNGLASYTAAGGRWGDYTAIIADPDGVSSWTLAEYPTSASSYRLSVAHLLSSAAAPPPPGCSSSTVGVNICSPAPGSTVNSPVTISAASLGNARITAMKAYANGVTVASSTGSTLNAQIALANNTYNLVVKAWDSTGAVYQKSESITVGGPPPAACSISTVGVKICAPTAGSTVSSPVQITAAAKGTNKITGMKAYANGVNVATSTGGILSAKVTLGPGTYTLTVKGWESTGTVHQTTETFTVH
ncbi:MAG TPA: Ig-like domain-containing protein [Candidatus Limnocylindrales bacterium]|nr:Ig-like domain-containing protein [Candidatus Limnocylindrales bacterium]